MSLGLPVVATPIGSNLEIIEDGVNGFLADSDEEWEDRLRTLIDNPELRRRMGDAARRTAEDRFGLSSQINIIENILRSTVDEKRLKQRN
jgi:glycosyltransferase involved in cell wall biosynthesis